MATFKFVQHDRVALGCILEVDGQEVHAAAFTLEARVGELSKLTLEFDVVATNVMIDHVVIHEDEDDE